MAFHHRERGLRIGDGAVRLPGLDEPKVWFSSAESFARILSDRNRSLLRVIAESAPQSLAELAELTGRKKSSIPDLEDHGTLWLCSASRGARGTLIPRVPYQRISLTLPLSKPERVGNEAA